MNKIPRFSCSPILPLTFNDSLSYYEQLSKLVYTINQLIQAFNGGIDEKIESYINAHFDELMMNAVYDAATETIILSWKE